jgi:hypothetical protein
MNSDQQELLDQMIRENDTKDNTGKIRELKHSAKIRLDVSKIQNIKRRCRSTQFNVLDKEARGQGCGFLFQHYPNIYNKLLKGEVDIKILYRFLDELASIEEGKQNQHEASYRIGMLLKEMYIDKRIDKEKEEKGPTYKKKTSTMSYEEFKKSQEANKN